VRKIGSGGVCLRAVESNTGMIDKGNHWLWPFCGVGPNNGAWRI
jgi:hypothetical protein